jgi:NAD(P)H-flavin reductase
MIAFSDPMQPVLYEVKSRCIETPDVFTFKLQPMEKSPCMSFQPGQFNMLYAYGHGEVPISISGDPRDGKFLVHTIRTVGNVTEALGRLKKGSIVGVRGPYGTCWPMEFAKGKDVLLVCGGIGLAPLRSVLYNIAAERAAFRRVFLLYGSRKPEDLLFKGELEHWRKQADIEVEVTVDTATGAWDGNVGVVTAIIPRVEFDASNVVAMLCGPEIMMRFAVLELERRRVPERRIFLSIERNMKCGIGFCGHCQCLGHFMCKDGPVLSFEAVKNYFGKREV